MRTKLTLDLENLSVESFETTLAYPEKGTVFGEEEPCTCPTQCTCQTQCTCPGCPSCRDTCDETCAASCGPVYCPPPTKDETCLYTCGTNSYCADCMG